MLYVQRPSKLPNVIRGGMAPASAATPSSTSNPSKAAPSAPPSSTTSPPKASPPAKKASPPSPVPTPKPATPPPAATAVVDEENHYDMLAPGESTAATTTAASTMASASADDVADVKNAIEAQRATNSALEQELAGESESFDRHSAELQILQEELKGLRRLVYTNACTRGGPPTEPLFLFCACACICLYLCARRDGCRACQAQFRLC